MVNAARLKDAGERNDVEAGMAKLLATLPADVQVTRYWDQTRLIAASQLGGQ